MSYSCGNKDKCKRQKNLTDRHYQIRLYSNGHWVWWILMHYLLVYIFITNEIQEVELVFGRGCWYAMHLQLIDSGYCSILSLTLLLRRSSNPIELSYGGDLLLNSWPMQLARCHRSRVHTWFCYFSQPLSFSMTQDHGDRSVLVFISSNNWLGDSVEVPQLFKNPTSCPKFRLSLFESRWEWYKWLLMRLNWSDSLSTNTQHQYSAPILSTNTRHQYSVPIHHLLRDHLTLWSQLCYLLIARNWEQPWLVG